MRNTHACIFFVQFSSIWATKNLIHTFVSPLVFVCKTRRTIRNLIVVRCHVYWFSYRRPCNFLVFESFPNMAFLFLSFFLLAGGAAKSVRRLVFSTLYFTIMSGRSAWISLSAWPLKLKPMFLSSYGASHRLCSHFFFLYDAGTWRYIKQMSHCKYSFGTSPMFYPYASEWIAVMFQEILLVI